MVNLLILCSTCLILLIYHFFYRHSPYSMNSIYNTNRLLSILSLSMFKLCIKNVLDKVFIVGTKLIHISVHSPSMNTVFAKSGMNRTIYHHKCLTSTMTGNCLVHKYRLVQNRVIHELKHYYNGFRLLVSQTRISCGLIYQLLNGRTLTRKERKQVLLVLHFDDINDCVLVNSDN